MNKHYSIFVILLLIIYSCSEKPKLVMTSFKDIPQEIEGCSCYFSKDAKLYAKGNYCFASNFDSLAFISLNNKLTKLKLKSSERKPETFGDYDHKEVYENDTLKVYLDIKYKQKTESEVWKNTGTIKVENSNGEIIIRKFEGECGC